MTLPMRPKAKPAVRRRSPNLRLRLWLSHILVGALSVGLITAISHVYKSLAFTREIQHLQQGIDLEKGIREREAFSTRDVLVRFHQINNQGTLFSVVITVLVLTAWGCTVGQLIVCPLGKIESAVRQAAAGDLAIEGSSQFYSRNPSPQSQHQQFDCESPWRRRTATGADGRFGP
jgi:hypothetical protein